MSYELRIPAERIDDERFAAIVAKLRMLFGVPADVMPRSQFDLRVVLGACTGNDYPLRKWLRDNGYEVVRLKYKGTLKGDYVIRRADIETIMWKNVAERMVDDIDKSILRILKGE